MNNPNCWEALTCILQPIVIYLCLKGAYLVSQEQKYSTLNLPTCRSKSISVKTPYYILFYSFNPLFTFLSEFTSTFPLALLSVYICSKPFYLLNLRFPFSPFSKPLLEPTPIHILWPILFLKAKERSSMAPGKISKPAKPTGSVEGSSFRKQERKETRQSTRLSEKTAPQDSDINIGEDKHEGDFEPTSTH